MSGLTERLLKYPALTAEDAAAYICKIEAERDAALKRGDALYLDGIKQASDRLVEIKALETATIERCAEEVESFRPDAARAIRALKRR